MMELFEKHWNEHPDKKCESCGVQLWGENLTLYHDHLLEKSIYDDLTFEVENLFLCCSTCHTLKGNGKATEKHLAAIEEARIKFGK